MKSSITDGFRGLDERGFLALRKPRLKNAHRNEKRRKKPHAIVEPKVFSLSIYKLNLKQFYIQYRTNTYLDKNTRVRICFICENCQENVPPVMGMNSNQTILKTKIIIFEFEN